MHNYISFLYDTKTKQLKLTEKCQDQENEYYYELPLGTASLVSSAPLNPSGIITPYTTTPIDGEGDDTTSGNNSTPSGDNP